MKPDFVTVTLENGATLRVETMPGGDEEVALSSFRFDDIRRSVVSLAGTVSSILEEVSPTSATAEFGIAVGVEAGKLTAMLVQGTAAANLKITLTWDRSKGNAAGGPSSA